VVINWKLRLLEICESDSFIANAIRAKLVRAGQAYEHAGCPDVSHESSEHQRWRTTVAAHLAACDRVAATIDAQPLTAIDPRHPAASARAIKERLLLAAAAAPPALAPLIGVMWKSPLPAEPPEFVSAHYAPSGLAQRSMGDVERALVEALAELNAYLERG